MPRARRPLLSRFIVVFVAVVALAFGEVGPAVAAEPSTGGVAGILSSANGEPVTSARVWAKPVNTAMQSRSALVDEGAFSITGLAPGFYYVMVELTDPADGGGEWWPGAPDRARAETIHVTAGVSAEASWRLTAIPAEVVGVVTDAVSGQPVVGYALQMTSPAVFSTASAQTDEAGVFRFPRVISGEYRIEGDESGDHRYSARKGADGWNVIVPDTGTVRSSIELTPRGRIVGTFSGLPTGWAARLEITEEGADHSLQLYPGNGRFESPYLEPGRYALQLIAPGDRVSEWWRYAPTRGEAELVTVNAGEDTAIDWAAREGGTLTGTITDLETGEPIPGLTVGTDPINPMGTTDQSGRYVIEGLPAGDFTLFVTGGAYTMTSTPFHTELGETTVVDVGAHRVGELEATVSWTGTDRGEVFVQLYDQDLKLVKNLGRQVGGSYKDFHLDAGKYFLRFVKSPDYLPTWFGGTTTAATSTPVVIEPGRTTTLAQELVLATSENSGSLRTTVRGPEGELVDDATVQVYDAEGLLRSSLVTVAGVTTAKNLPPGRYRVRVLEFDTRTWNGGTLPWRYPYEGTWIGGVSQDTATPFDVVAGGAHAALVQLSRNLPGDAGTVTGRVLQGTTPVVGGQVRVITAPPAGGGQSYAVATGYTDATGRYTIRGLPPRTYRIVIEDAPHWTQEVKGEYIGGSEQSATTFALAAGGTVSLDHRWTGAPVAPGAAIIRGRVTAADTGAPQSGISVQVGAATVATDEDGYYEASVYAAGAIAIRSAAPEGYSASAVISRTIALGTVTATDFSLTRPLSAVTPGIPSSARVGVAAKATAGAWTSGTTLTYQWRRSGTAIAGATSATYTPTATDRGTALSVAVTGRKPGFTTTTTVSASLIVAAGVLVTSAPKVSGTVKVGRTLTAIRGTWTAGTTYSYQWYRNGAKISHATAKTYKLTWRDAGKKITVKVTGGKVGYTAATRASAATKAVRR